MTRPMPGPPDWYDIDWNPTWGMVWVKNGDECDETFNHAELDKKRLTHVECAAHEWQADAELERAARNLDDDYYNPHRFRLRAEYERRLDEWDTWVEFTLHPHALEEA